MRTLHFAIVRARGNQPFRVHIIAANGRKLFTSETYASRRSAWRAALSVIGWEQAGRVPIVDTTQKRPRLV